MTAQEIPAGKTSEEVIGAAITAGTAPCLVYNTSPAAVPGFQKQGGLVAIDDLPGGKEYIESRTGATADQYKSPDGKFYRLPWKSNPVMIFYNKKAAEEGRRRHREPAAGDVRRLPRHQPQDRQQRRREGRDLAGAVVGVLPVVVRLLPAVRRRERRRAWSRTARRPSTTRPARPSRASGAPCTARRLAQNEAYNGDSFADGKAAMSIVGPWAVAVYGKKVDWGVAPVPTSTGKPASDVHTFSDAKNVAIYSACKNQGTAFDLLKFSTSEEQDGKPARGHGSDAAAQGRRHDVQGVLRRAPGLPDLRRPGLAHRRGAQRAELGAGLADVPRRLLVVGHLRQAAGRRGAQRSGDEGDVARRPVVSATTAGAVDRPPLLRRVVGRQPLGIAFTLPYALFLAAVFAYPLGYAVWMSLPRLLLHRTGRRGAPPLRGVRQLRHGAHRPGRAALVPQRRRVPRHQRPADRGAVAGAGERAERGDPAAHVPAHRVLRAVRDGERGGRRRVAVPVQRRRPGQLGARAAGPRPVVAGEQRVGDAGDRGVRHLEARGSSSCCTWRRCRTCPRSLHEAASVDGAGRFRRFLSVTVPGVRPATFLVVLLATITGGNLFTEPYLLTGGGGPDGASSSPVLVMYQRGVQQGNPDVAAAIGVVLVLIVLLLGLVQRRVFGRED
nr:extracellular solute-binding protein [Angustibacter aerolatus]